MRGVVWVTVAGALAGTPGCRGETSPAGESGDETAAGCDEVEICDGLDNDCNGMIDDDATDALDGFLDRDGDGYGDAAFTGCAAPADAALVEVGGDCRDDDESVYPGAAETCNGVDDDCNGLDDDGIPNDGAGCVDPGRPIPPELVDVITVTVRTGDGPDDGVDGSAIALCLTDARCFPLDVEDVDDAIVGAIDVHHFENIDVAATDWDQVTIRYQSGTDNWKPSCLQIDFDGETVYCEDQLDTTFGLGVGESPTWTDASGYHVDCSSCYPGPITHGPTIGAVDSDAARLWLRTEATRRAALHVTEGESSEPAEASPVAFVYPAARDDYTGEALVRGLNPSTRYRYAWEVDGTFTAPHGFITPPAPGEPTQVRFAFGSCARSVDQPAFAAMQFMDPSLFLFVGDAQYANSDDLSSERWFYRWSLERPERAAFFAETPAVAVWDDHDFTGDNTDGFEPGKDVALRTFAEYWANPSAGDGSTPGVFFTYRWGDIEFFMTDVRYHRAVDGSMLGAEQAAWLLQALEDSDATFKFVVGGSQFTGEGSSDSWAAFPESQAELFDHIADASIEGVVLLSGDVHRSEFRIIDRSAAGAYDLPELSSSPLANTNTTCTPTPEELFCFDSGDYFVTVDVDTTLPDPAFRAQIVDSFTTVMAELTVAHSELEF